MEELEYFQRFFYNAEHDDRYNEGYEEGYFDAEEHYKHLLEREYVMYAELEDKYYELEEEMYRLKEEF